MANEPKVNLKSATVRLPDDDYLRLMKYCSEKGRNISDAMRIIVHEYLRNTTLTEEDQLTLQHDREVAKEKRIEKRSKRNRRSGFIARIFGR